MYNQNSLFIMANPNITMSEETKKFQEAVNEYLALYPDAGGWVLLLIYLIKEKALRYINSNLETINRSDLMVMLYFPAKLLKEKLIKEGFQYSDSVYNLDTFVIELPLHKEKILKIAKCFNIDLDYASNVNKDADQWCNQLTTYLALNSISSEWYQENACWAFEEVVCKISKEWFDIEAKQPNEVSLLLLSLLDCKKGELYNPYAGTEFVNYIHWLKNKNFTDFYYTQTQSLFLYGIMELSNLFLPLHHFPSYRNEDSTKNWLGNIEFDYIFSTPPWGVKLYDSEFPTIELDYLARSSRDTKHKSIGVYTSSICYNGSSKSIIEELIENDWLETVILFPKNIFSHTTIETVLILVNKKKEHTGQVRIIDASDCFIKDAKRNILDTNAVLAKLDDNDNLFSNKEICELDYNIYPRLYALKNNADIPEHYLVQKVNTLIEAYTGSRRFSQKEGKVVTIADLSDNSLSSRINIEELKTTDDLRRAIKVTEPVFLFSRIRDLKPSYCEATPEHPIFLHPNVFAYKLRSENGWVDYQYFCYEISRRAKDIAVGIIPSISKSVLQRLNVYFPSENIEDQRRIIKEALLQLKLSQAKELGLQELIENMKAEYMNEIRMRKHDMRPHLTNLGSIGRLMQSYIKQLDGMPELQNKLSSLVAEHVKAVESLSNLVSVLSEEQTFGKAEEINLNQLFIDLEKSNDRKISGFKLVYHIDRNALDASEISNEDDSTENIPLYVKIARIDFERLVTNILENARTHGFANKEDDNGVVSIFVTVNSENDSFQIDFINNGNPLPEGMNKMRFGLRGEKAGNTGGTGNGGYIIKSIVEHYKGDYDVFMDADDTVIRVLLPISRESYE